MDEKAQDRHEDTKEIQERKGTRQEIGDRQESKKQSTRDLDEREKREERGT